MEGFLLGLSTGTTCLAYCAPVLVPFMLGEGQPVRRNGDVLLKFLSGRLLGYLLFGVLAWLAGRLVFGAGGVLQDGRSQALLLGPVYLLLAGLLLFYGLARPPAPCAGTLRGPRAWLSRWPALLPFGLGFLTGLNLCPPFLLALTRASNSGAMVESVLFFGAFFVGTSLYFIPIPFLGAFNRFSALRTIGKWAAVLVSLYYVYSGMILLVGGMVPS